MFSRFSRLSTFSQVLSLMVAVLSGLQLYAEEVPSHSFQFQNGAVLNLFTFKKPVLTLTKKDGSVLNILADGHVFSMPTYDPSCVGWDKDKYLFKTQAGLDVIPLTTVRPSFDRNNSYFHTDVAIVQDGLGLRAIHESGQMITLADKTAAIAPPFVGANSKSFEIIQFSAETQPNDTSTSFQIVRLGFNRTKNQILVLSLDASGNFKKTDLGLQSRDAHIQVTPRGIVIDHTQMVPFDGVSVPVVGNDLHVSKNPKEREVEKRLLVDPMVQDSNGKAVTSSSVIADFTEQVDLDFLQKRNPIQFALEEFENIRIQLHTKQGGSAVITGESGSGKSERLWAFAQQIKLGAIPEIPKERVILTLDATSIAANTKWVGIIDTKLKALMEFAKANQALILIDEIQNLSGVGTHSGESIRVLGKLKQALSQADIQIIGTTTHDEYLRFLSGDEALARRLPEFPVTPLAKADLPRALQGWISRHHGELVLPDFLVPEVIAMALQFDVKASEISRCVRLMDRLISLYTLKGIDLKTLSAQTVRTDAIKFYGFEKAFVDPAARIHAIESAQTLIDANVIGQESAKEALQSDVRKIFTQSYDPSKPMGRRILAGPKGVGKTYLMQTFSEAIGAKYHRFLMSEYTTWEDIEKLKSAIVDAVNHSPFCVLFFDEIEKAPKHIQNALLELTDSDTIKASVKTSSNYHADTKQIKIGISRVYVAFGTNAGQATVLKYSTVAKPARVLGFSAGLAAGSSETLPLSAEEIAALPELEREMIQDGITEFLFDRRAEITVMSIAKSKAEFGELLAFHARRIDQKLAQQTGISLDGDVVAEITGRVTELYWGPIESRPQTQAYSPRQAIANIERDLSEEFSNLRLDLDAQAAGLTLDGIFNKPCSSLFTLAL